MGEAGQGKGTFEMNDSIADDYIRRTFAKSLDRQIRGAFGIGDSYTANAPGDDGPGLTLESLLATIKRLEEMLPELVYHTTEAVPQLNVKGEPDITYLDHAQAQAVMGDDSFDRDHLVILHPDNLPALTAKVRGSYRLVPLKVSKANE